jgi:hypothetical protein
MQFRRSDYDVTNTVQVSSPGAVQKAIVELFRTAYPDHPFAALEGATDDLERLFGGRFPGYLGVDTVYHDLQHTLDVVLAMARLVCGYEMTHRGTAASLGPERALMGLVVAHFHDAGYIRSTTETGVANGAVFTKTHVTRSAHFIARYLTDIGMGAWVSVATRIVHFTGYEVPFDRIEVADPRDRKTGHLLGTADMLAQMADRCYLEKCRDRLYAEFVLGGVAAARGRNGVATTYGSGLDLLRKTPGFIDDTLDERLEGEFEHAFRYMEPVFGGANPYLQAVRQNVAYARRLLRTGRWPLLKRNPPLFTVDAEVMTQVRQLMVDELRQVWEPGSTAADPLES